MKNVLLETRRLGCGLGGEETPAVTDFSMPRMVDELVASLVIIEIEGLLLVRLIKAVRA